MRRRVLTAVVVAAGSWWLTIGRAFAEEEGEATEAPNPILPATNEIIWGSIAFVILLWAMWKFGFPAVKSLMDERTERIRADLQAAEDAKNEAQSALDGYQAQLADAKSEAARIIDEARQAAEAMRAELQTRAEADIAEMRERAQADIASARDQAVADLRAEVASLAIGAAETVVEGSLDRDTQVRLVESYIDRVSSSS